MRQNDALLRFLLVYDNLLAARKSFYRLDLPPKAPPAAAETRREAHHSSKRSRIEPKNRVETLKKGVLAANSNRCRDSVPGNERKRPTSRGSVSEQAVVG